MVIETIPQREASRAKAGRGLMAWRFRWRGLVGGVVLITAAVLTLFSRPLIVAHSPADVAIDVVAYSLFLAGAALRFWATLYIGGSKDKRVVSEGPYSVCRNPLYLGSLALAVSLSLFSKSGTLLLGVLIVAWFYARHTVPAEERHLRGKLGDAYLDYLKRVPRFVPNFNLFHTPRTVEVLVRAVRREFLRGLRGWLWFPLLGEGIAYLRALSWWPHWFSLF
jgi:protein-S-isoprenylcysteine O-methyltransferase Ste14